MRVMIDSNILDRLDADTEAQDELLNRRDLLLLVTATQEREVLAIPDPARRGRLGAILARLCRRLALPVPPSQALPPTDAPYPIPHSSPGEPPQIEGLRQRPKSAPDDSIIAAAQAAGCELLVSEDLEMLNKAVSAGLRAMNWRLFLSRVLWSPRNKRH